jgi:large subunit ribosomal protein L16
MAYMPKRIKHRKVFKGRIKGYASRGNRVSFGEFGLQALDAGRLNGRQLEASRIAANRATQGAAKIWIRVFPDRPVSSKPAETRMGKGKGDLDYWAAVVRPGTILFELGNVTEEKAKLAFKRIAHKLPIRVRMVKRVPTV